MNTLEAIRPLSRRAVDLTLRTTRLPLTVAERITGRDGGPETGWAPALYFAGFESLLLRTAGTLLRDDELIRRGRLEETAVYHRERALELEQRAEQAREVADERAARRQAAAVQGAKKRKAAADSVAAARRRQVREAKEHGDKLLEDEARVRRAAELDAQRRAVAAEREAVETARETADLERRIERS